mmetsp:Transcript_15907/g.31694  ORF Transcript_15907/g.31694 Transcript_15907/m.31694 type:complete len:787 (-) Transcript_15907:94-2454(-)
MISDGMIHHHESMFIEDGTYDPQYLVSPPGHQAERNTNLPLFSHPQHRRHCSLPLFIPAISSSSALKDVGTYGAHRREAPAAQKRPRSSSLLLCLAHPEPPLVSAPPKQPHTGAEAVAEPHINAHDDRAVVGRGRRRRRAAPVSSSPETKWSGEEREEDATTCDVDATSVEDEQIQRRAAAPSPPATTTADGKKKHGDEDDLDHNNEDDILQQHKEHVPMSSDMEPKDACSLEENHNDTRKRDVDDVQRVEKSCNGGPGEETHSTTIPIVPHHPILPCSSVYDGVDQLQIDSRQRHYRCSSLYDSVYQQLLKNDQVRTRTNNAGDDNDAAMDDDAGDDDSDDFGSFHSFAPKARTCGDVVATDTKNSPAVVRDGPSSSHQNRDDHFPLPSSESFLQYSYSSSSSALFLQASISDLTHDTDPVEVRQQVQQREAACSPKETICDHKRAIPRIMIQEFSDSTYQVFMTVTPPSAEERQTVTSFEQHDDDTISALTTGTSFDSVPAASDHKFLASPSNSVSEGSSVRSAMTASRCRRRQLRKWHRLANMEQAADDSPPLQPSALPSHPSSQEDEASHLGCSFFEGAQRHEFQGLLPKNTTEQQQRDNRSRKRKQRRCSFSAAPLSQLFCLHKKTLPSGRTPHPSSEHEQHHRRRWSRLIDLSNRKKKPPRRSSSTCTFADKQYCRKGVQHAGIVVTTPPPPRKIAPSGGSKKSTAVVAAQNFLRRKHRHSSGAATASTGPVSSHASSSVWSPPRTSETRTQVRQLRQQREHLELLSSTIFCTPSRSREQ